MTSVTEEIIMLTVTVMPYFSSILVSVIDDGNCPLDEPPEKPPEKSPEKLLNLPSGMSISTPSGISILSGGSKPSGGEKSPDCICSHLASASSWVIRPESTACYSIAGSSPSSTFPSAASGRAR